MSQVFGEIGPGEEALIGRFDDNGRLYVLVEEFEELIGTTDYRSGKVYDLDGDLFGWIDDEGYVIVNDGGDDELVIGAVDENGGLFIFVTEDGDREQIGRVADMKHPAEGAAALLFFIEDDEEEVE